MLDSHTYDLRSREIRSRLNELSGMEESEEVLSEMDTLSREFRSVDTKYRAALVRESQESDTRTYADDSEGREIRDLLSAVSLTDYLGPAVQGVGISGRAGELNSALGIPIIGANGGVAVPWAFLEQRADIPDTLETRAFTTTTQLDGGENQRPIMQRLFGPGIMDTLGVRLDAVPAGKTEWPLITAGTTIGQVAEGTAAAAAVAATFNTEVLKPKRLTGRFEYTHEQAAEVADIEAALRRDLTDAAKSQMENQVINGNEASNPQEPDGFLTTLTAPTGTPTTATYPTYAMAHADAVDGIHAMMETQVSSVIGVTTYKHAAGIIQAGSGESASEALMRRSMMCVASSYIPAANNDGDQAAIFHANGPNGGGGTMRGDSVAAIWPALEIIRDIYTQASIGVVLTYVGLWDAQTAFRAAAYDRQVFRTV